jgi:hypothetical protein
MGLRRPISSLVNLVTLGRAPGLFGPLLGLVALRVSFVSPCFAEDTRIHEITSPAILLRTDLRSDQATELHRRLDELRSHLVDYWNQPLAGQIVCFVVVDLNNWRDAALPAEAREKLRSKAGTTLTERITLNGKIQSVQSTVYAVADGRTPLHEFVHAFCWQTFNRVGPDWFAEGMAEISAYWHAGDKSVHCPNWVVKYLQQDSNPPTPSQIITNDLGKRTTWQVYAHRWALCYLLIHHPRYADRFREFGRALLRGKDVDFARDFGDVEQPLAADYRQLLRDVREGYEIPQE